MKPCSPSVRGFATLVVLSLPVWPMGCSGTVGLDADRMNTFQLMTAAAAATSIESKGFFFYAAEMRFRIDKQVYPPVAQGGDAPGVLKAALGATIGPSIGPKLANDPVAIANVAKRLAAWTPRFDMGYDPGWKYQTALDAQAASAVVASVCAPVLGSLRSKAKLADNEEYVRKSRELADAARVIKKIEAATIGQGRLPANLKPEYDAAASKRAAAARRMKQIEWELAPESRWHAKAEWKAEDYFQDPQVVALCRAIEADDVKEMERLIDAGADVNAIGKDGMTLLLWAFPENKIERFACLLRHGANPNVPFDSDFGVGNRPFHPYDTGGSSFLDRGCHAGQSVIHLASRSPEIEYLRLVVANGGDVNLEDKKTGETPLDIVLDRHIFDLDDRVKLLVANKANLNHYCAYKLAYPVMQAVQIGHYDLALFLLQAGANPHLYQPDGTRKLIHIVLREQRNLQHLKEPVVAQYEALVDWLKQHGETIDAARADEQRWAKMYANAFTPEAHGKLTKQIIAERNAQPPVDPAGPAK